MPEAGQAAPTFTLPDQDGREALEAYGAWGEKVLYGRTSVGVIRCTFLIAPDGTIAKVWKRVQTKQHADRVLAALDQLRTA